jgi:hypothetical protein
MGKFADVTGPVADSAIPLRNVDATCPVFMKIFRPDAVSGN